MNRALAGFVVLLAVASSAQGQYQGVSATRHNLSVSGPGEIKALTETEVCKFCHIPHNAVVPAPLWSHALSEVARYETPAVRRGLVGEETVPQPEGSSRLCLSCHDGTVALGDVGRGGTRIVMAGAQRLAGDRPGHLGTDLSGSHPVSIVMPTEDPATGDGAADMGLRPRDLVEAEEGIRLDEKGRIQCSTCHDPHSDRHFVPGRVPRFWVRPTVNEVCLACHDPR